MLFFFSSSFSCEIPHNRAHTLLIWVRAPSSHFHNPVLKYFQTSHFYTPYTQAELDFAHSSCSVCSTGGAVAYSTLLMVSSLQNKEKKLNGGSSFCLLCAHKIQRKFNYKI